MPPILPPKLPAPMPRDSPKTPRFDFAVVFFSPAKAAETANKRMNTWKNPQNYDIEYIGIKKY